MPRLAGAAARELFASARVARLGTVSADGVPHLVPCTFVVAGDSMYVAVDQKPKSTTDLKRLRNIRANPAVCLLVDHYDEDWTSLWWVRADGLASVVTEAGEMAGPIELLVERYPQYRDAPPTGPLIAIQVTFWSGWSA